MENAAEALPVRTDSPQRKTPLAGHGIVGRAYRVILFSLLWGVLAALLLLRIGARPLFSDEIPAAEAAAQVPSAALENAAHDRRPPLFYWLCSHIGLVQRHFVLPPISPRLLSAFFAWLALWPASRLMRSASHLEAFSLLFCLLFAASPFWIEAGRMACPYALFGLLALVSTDCLFSLFRSPRLLTWLAYLGSAVLMLYADWMAFAVLAGHGLTALTAAPGRSEQFGFRHAFGVAAAWLIALAAFSPWLVLATRPTIDLPWPIVGSWSFLDFLQYAGFSAGYTSYMFQFGDSMAPWNALRAALLSLPALVAACYGLERAFESHNRSLRRTLAIGLIGFLASIAAFSLGSSRPHAFDVPLRVAFLYPFACVALAYGFGVMNKFLSVPLLAIVLGVNAYSLESGYFGREHTNWAYATPLQPILAAIGQHSAPETLLVIDTYNLKQIDYYYQGDLPQLRLREDLEPHADLSQRLQPYRRVLFVHATRDRSEDRRLTGTTRILEEQFRRAETLPLLVEDPTVSEIKTYLGGAPVDPAKIRLDVYER